MTTGNLINTEAGIVTATDDDSILQKIKDDLRHYALREQVPANISFVLRMFLVTPGFQFVFARRVQELLYHIPLFGRVLRRIAWWLTCMVFGSELGIASKIGGGLYIPHPFGIVVGISHLSKNITILQNVTIGKKSRAEPGAPRIESGAFLAAGAVVLGNITIGENSIVGANSVVTRDVPPNSMAVGVPARILPLAKPDGREKEVPGLADAPDTNGPG